jgi:hypothetical protein
MASATDHVRLSELFEALEGPAAEMIAALAVHAPGRGRLSRSSWMLSNAVAKLKMELERYADRELHPDLKAAEVSMYDGPTDIRDSARDLVLALHPDKG